MPWYRGGGARQRGGNCFGLCRCTISIIICNGSSFRTHILYGEHYDGVQTSARLCKASVLVMWQVMQRKLWRDSSADVEREGLNGGEWQRCRDKASCQSPQSVTHRPLQPPSPPCLHERPSRQDRSENAAELLRRRTKPNICFVKRHWLLHLSHPYSQSDCSLPVLAFRFWLLQSNKRHVGAETKTTRQL